MLANADSVARRHRVGDKEDHTRNGQFLYGFRIRRSPQE